MTDADIMPFGDDTTALAGNAKSVTFNGGVDVVQVSNGTVNSTVIAIVSSQGGGMQPVIPSSYDGNHYNLFVVDGGLPVQFSVQTISLAESIALTKGTDEDVRRVHCRLDEGAISSIRSYPSILASVNEEYGKPGSDQMALVGFVQDVTKSNGNILISFFPMKPIRQRLLLECAHDLMIRTAELLNELDDVHWAIKRVDLLSKLKERGIDAMNVMEGA